MGLLNQLVVAEEVLDGLLLSVKLILKDLDLRLELHAVISQLVVEHLHLYGLVVELLLLLRLQSVLGRLGLGWPSRMR